MNARALLIATFFALLAAGASECGEPDRVIELPLCEGVICPDDFSCDEADGICKCGGAVCQPGQSCSLEPSPTCVDSKCEFVQCDRGQRCDDRTGACVCGASTCAEDEYCVDRRCTAADPCSGVRCDDGQRCDPTDGVCKCAGAECAHGEACIDGRCTFSLCAGVHCTTNNVCNPADGSCHCATYEGPLCVGGEACLPVGATDAYACAAVDHCDGVVCQGGTTCDPVDGACRCGADGSICSDEQTCLDGKCLGGRFCTRFGVEVVCDGNLSCDPADGLCKCGGANGELCAESQTCTLLGPGALACARNCDPLAVKSECAVGESCYFTAPGVPATCVQTGLVGVGKACKVSSDCSGRQYCTARKECRPLCDVRDGDQGCEAPTTCDLLDAGISLGYCRNP